MRAGWFVVEGGWGGVSFFLFLLFLLLLKANIKRLHSPNGKNCLCCRVPGHGAFEHLQEDMHKGLSIKFVTHIGCRFGVSVYQIMTFIFYLLVQIPLDHNSLGLVGVTSRCDIW